MCARFGRVFIATVLFSATRGRKERVLRELPKHYPEEPRENPAPERGAQEPERETGTHTQCNTLTLVYQYIYTTHTHTHTLYTPYTQILDYIYILHKQSGHNLTIRITHTVYTQHVYILHTYTCILSQRALYTIHITHTHHRPQTAILAVKHTCTHKPIIYIIFIH